MAKKNRQTKEPSQPTTDDLDAEELQKLTEEVLNLREQLRTSQRWRASIEELFNPEFRELIRKIQTEYESEIAKLGIDYPRTSDQLLELWDTLELDPKKSPLDELVKYGKRLEFDERTKRKVNLIKQYAFMPATRIVEVFNKTDALRKQLHRFRKDNPEHDGWVEVTLPKSQKAIYLFDLSDATVQEIIANAPDG